MFDRNRKSLSGANVQQLKNFSQLEEEEEETQVTSVLITY